MGIENPVHLIFLAAVALVVLGPKRLPELARAAGKGMREFRESLNGEGSAEEPAGPVVVQPATLPTPQQTRHRRLAASSPAAGSAIRSAALATAAAAPGAAPLRGSGGQPPPAARRRTRPAERRSRMRSGAADTVPGCA